MEIDSSILRCQLDGCNKKLTLTNNFQCACSNYYCMRHKFSLDHGCKYDYKKQQRDLLQKSLIKINHEKIIKI